ncbi:phosphoenolpyruvate synthase [Aphanothece sacrum FPU3]|nr:phosphoenolpyruvate synthase [Aphanothece sacrum FPU3]
MGGLPLIEWITHFFTGQKLSTLGTKNVSVSAAFYHGGTFVGILCVLSEAGKGIISVLLARHFFPEQPVWELISLIALIVGRYWMGKGAGTTNLFWGIMVHDWQANLLTTLISGGSFTIIRDRFIGRLVTLFLLAFILTVRHSGDSNYVIMSWILVGLVAWIFQKIPDDLDLPETGVNSSKKMFKFFRGDQAILSLNNLLKPQKVGQKAATLSYLKRLGYQVPDGWILLPGDDPQPLLDYLDPQIHYPLVVRSSAIGEDSETASAAGQYRTILNVNNPEVLKAAIIDCFTSYNNGNAVQYRQDRGQDEQGMVVLIQIQVKGVFSGVAFSRDPVNPVNDIVVVEALPGEAKRVVSGQFTPEQYRVMIQRFEDNDVITIESLPDQVSGDIPPQLIEMVASLTRDIEDLYHGIPQDIEWSYDGQQLWLLQARSITTLQPIWTRKIASEVIPGVIHPLTWSINRPLTCGVWGDLFTLVLGKKTQGLDFNETATLHYQQAYFNATLLGSIFQRMGLPADSLEFLLRGEKFSKPPLISTLQNTPGLLRLFKAESKLEKDFNQEYTTLFEPTLTRLFNQSLNDLSESQLLDRIETILLVLKRATYYSILAPLSLALRQTILKVSAQDLDNRYTPEIASIKALENLASQTIYLIDINGIETQESLFLSLENHPDGHMIIENFQHILEEYGYLSDIATDISIPRWKDNSASVKKIFTQLLINQNSLEQKLSSSRKIRNWKITQVQKRLNLKGKVTEIYSQLLAQLRWSFLAIGELFHHRELIKDINNIFLLTHEEIIQLIESTENDLQNNISQLLEQRQREFEENQKLTNIPYVVYGNITPTPVKLTPSPLNSKQQLRGIGASPGKVEGIVKICKNLQYLGEIEPNTILVVPYTDSGWGPWLARASGIIAEVGGSLSHGAIIAREYGIPAVMNIHHATQLLKDGQIIRLDGQLGIIEIL